MSDQSVHLPFPAKLFKATKPLAPFGAVLPFPFRRKAEPDVLGRSGTLEVRLAVTPKDIKRAQKLRYRVFYEEMAAVPDLHCRIKRRDIDPYDAVCDHLLVVDLAAPAKPLPGMKAKPGRTKPRVVGTYRLLRQERAALVGGFYSQAEFDIAPMLKAHPGARFVELGRSCVEKPYRDKRTVELLWHGIWAYVRRHRIDVMFGCASFEGTDPDALALPLGFLHHHALADAEWRVKPLAHRAVAMDRLAGSEINLKQAMQAMPPLIKGYLRVGAKFGDGAVVDRQFGTTDVLVILPVRDIHPKYIGYFGADGHRYAA
jgi:putative hemolysin